MKKDFRKLGIEKAFADMFKKDFTNELKEYLRENKDILGNEYLQVVRDDYRKPAQYSKEDQAEIDKFIKERGFKKVENPLQKDYSIELVATAKARKEAEKILLNAIKNASKVLAKSASKIMENRKWGEKQWKDY